MPHSRRRIKSRFSPLSTRLALWALLLLFAIAGATSCAPRGPVLGSGEAAANLSGTISGTVRAAGSNSPLTARKVIAIHLASDQRFEASTGLNGGYTMKVPVGRYRLEVELRSGESVSEGPGEFDIDDSDLDANRDFLIAVTPAQRLMS